MNRDKIIENGLKLCENIELLPEMMDSDGKNYCTLIQKFLRTDGEVIKEYRLNDGRYLYECYEKDSNKPYEIFFGTSRVVDLDKNTDINGKIITYQSASATIGQNMNGIFYDYETGIKFAGQFKSIGLYARCVEDLEAKVESTIASYNINQSRPTKLLEIQFHDQKVFIPGGVQIYNDQDGKIVFRIGLAAIKENGNFDLEKFSNDQRYFSLANSSINSSSPYKEYFKIIDHADAITQAAYNNGMMIFAPVLDSLGIPVLEETLTNNYLNDFTRIINGNFTSENVERISNIDNRNQLSDNFDVMHMLDKINNLINQKFNTNKGYFIIFELLKKEYGINLNPDLIKNIKIINMDEKYHEKTHFTGEYVANCNTLKIYNDPSLSDDELLSCFFHELIHALSSKIVNESGKVMLYQGFNIRNDSNVDSLFIGLNEGITQMITNQILAFNDNKAYFAQTYIATLLSEILGKNEIVQMYFNNDYVSLINSLLNRNHNIDIRKLMTDIYNFHNLSCNGRENQSDFDEIVQTIQGYSLGDFSL